VEEGKTQSRPFIIKYTSRAGGLFGRNTLTPQHPNTLSSNTLSMAL
jgi:hypothetical protein